MSGSHYKRSSRHGLHSLTGDRVLVVMLVAAMVVGVALIAYPIVSNWLSRIEREKVEQTHEKAIEETPEEDLSAYKAAAEQYNQELLAGKTVVTDPFDPNSLNNDSAELYWQVLNLNGDGIMGTLTIPKLGVALPVYHGTEEDELQKGVGHMATTSVPIGGPSTHAVIAGHTGLPAMVVFDRLDTLTEGDYFVIRVLGEDHAYRITGTEVVLPTETDSLAIQDGKDLVTLVTCTPYGVNDHRLLVHAERCEVPAEYYEDNHGVSPAEAVASAAADPVTTFSYIGVAVAITGLLFALAQLLRAHVKRGKHLTAQRASSNRKSRRNRRGERE